MDLTEAEIKKRWQEYTELYKKDLHDPDNHEGVITHTHLELDILEYEVRWALGSITTNKASGGDGIPVELFQFLKDDAVKVLHSICQQIWKTAVATGLEKVSFHSNFKERQCLRMLKLPHSCTHLIHDLTNAQNSPSQASAIPFVLCLHPQGCLRRGVRASGPSQGRTGESGAFGLWPHPRGSSRISS